MRLIDEDGSTNTSLILKRTFRSVSKDGLRNTQNKRPILDRKSVV